jgi:hypothetical protein
MGLDTNWLTSVDGESWYGVTLVSGHVDALSVSNNALTGNLGTGLKLPFLRALDVSRNTSL